MYVSASASGNPLYVAGGSSGWVIFSRSGKELYLNANYGDANQTAQVSPAAASNMGLSLSSRETEEDLYITGSTGFVGIGTKTPAANLHIYRAGQPPESDSLYGNVILDTDSTTNFQRIRFDVGVTPYWGLTRIGTSNNFAISGRIGSTWSDAVFVIQQSSGYVGINTTSPASLLQLVGSGTSDQGLFITTTGTGNDFYAIKVGTGTSTDVFAVTNAGRVGIGTTSPATRLQISGVNNDSYGQLRILATGTGADAQISFETPSNGRGIYVDDSDTNKMKFYTGAGKGTGDMVTFDNTGNVGIGTASPATALQVNGTARATRINSTGGVVDFDAQTGNNFISVSSGNMSIANNGTVNVYISGSGNVGIGTSTPIAKLDVEGDFQLLNANYNSYSSSVSGTTTLATIPTSSYNGVFFDFVAFSGSNQRAGTLIGNWRSGTVQYTEYSTPDIGATSAALTMSVALSGANALVQSVSAPGWAIKATYRTV